MNSVPVLSDIEYICDIFHRSFGIPTHFIDNNGNIIYEFSSIPNNPLYASKEALLQQLYSQNDPYDFPIIRSTKYLETFFIIKVKESDEFKGSIIAGPTIHTEASEDVIDSLLHDLHVAKKENIVDYYQSIPIYGSLQFINSSAQMYYMIYREKIDPSYIFDENRIFEQNAHEFGNTDVEIAKLRQDNIYHIDPVHEKIIMQCIKDGKKEELVNLIKTFNEKAKVAVLSKNSYLRSHKNFAIATITLATRSATDGGLPPEIAFTLSDMYIQSLEELKDRNSVISLLINAVYDFAERVQKSKGLNYSKPITICTGYIFNNLYNENLTVSAIANKAAMHPNYLSNLFKKEVGLTIHGYIQIKKVEEAKKLIAYSQYSLAEVYTLLNFYDQSHFTKVFKKVTGLTPREFKKDHGDV